MVRLEKELGGWIIGEGCLMLIIGVVTFIGFYLIGVPYALPLAVLAGLLEIIPNLGPIIAAIPAVLLAFVYGGAVTGSATLVFTIVVQQLENILIVPQVMKNTADVNPIISILLILAGLQIFGIVGALLAVPIYMSIRIFYNYWIKDHLLGYEKKLKAGK